MIKHVNDMVPPFLQKEMLRLVSIERDWLECQWSGETIKSGADAGKVIPDEHFVCRAKHTTVIERIWRHAAEALAVQATSHWLSDGPKLFRPTTEQCQALEQVNVPLMVGEYSQPFQNLVVDLPAGYLPMTAVLCGLYPRFLVLVCNSFDHNNDITTVIRSNSPEPIEVSLNRYYDQELDSVASLAHRAYRVAVNSCLVLSDHDISMNYLYPKEVVSDQRLALEDTLRGQRARERLQTAVHLVSLDKEVRLHRTEGSFSNGEPTGREVMTHWRRGHWHTVAHGTGKQQRKRVLYPPVLVRADRATVDVKQATTTYRI